MQQRPNQVANQAKQGPGQAQTAASIDSVATSAYGSPAPRRVAGDTAEGRAAMQARLELRDERGLKLAPVDRGGVNAIGPMPRGTYAFTSPRELMQAVANDTTSLPVRVRRGDSFDFEIHNVNGVRYVTGFVQPQVASSLQRTYFSSGTNLELFSTAAGTATCPIEIPLSSLRAPSFVDSPTPLLKVTIQPRTKDEPYVPRRVVGCPSGVMAK